MAQATQEIPRIEVYIDEEALAVGDAPNRVTDVVVIRTIETLLGRARAKGGRVIEPPELRRIARKAGVTDPAIQQTVLWEVVNHLGAQRDIDAPVTLFGSDNAPVPTLSLNGQVAYFPFKPQPIMQPSNGALVAHQVDAPDTTNAGSADSSTPPTPLLPPFIPQQASPATHKPTTLRAPTAQISTPAPSAKPATPTTNERGIGKVSGGDVWYEGLSKEQLQAIMAKKAAREAAAGSTNQSVRTGENQGRQLRKYGQPDLPPSVPAITSPGAEMSVTRLAGTEIQVPFLTRQLAERLGRTLGWAGWATVGQRVLIDAQGKNRYNQDDLISLLVNSQLILQQDLLPQDPRTPSRLAVSILASFQLQLLIPEKERSEATRKLCQTLTELLKQGVNGINIARSIYHLFGVESTFIRATTTL